MRVIAFSVAVASLLLTVRSGVAHACSPPGDGIYGRTVQPPDGATGVPINAEIRLRYEGRLEIDPQIRVRPVGELPIEVEVEAVDYRLFIARPTGGLEANTTYEVLDRVQVPCDRECMSPGFQVVASFTTGDAADVTPPTFAGLASVNSRYIEFDGTCGEYSTVIFDLSWEQATDDHPTEWLRYNVYDDRGRGVSLYAGTSVSGQALCGGSADFWPIEAPFSGPTGEYWVRAVDLAGNEDANMRKMATGSCSGSPPPAPDGGPQTPGVDPDTHQARGCAVMSPPLAGHGQWLALAVIAALAWRRRRRAVPRRT